MFALVDCNSFYASCEQIFRPDLRHQPVVILSNNDGCIVARSKEAKLFNIPELSPFFQIKHLLEKNKIHVFSSNYALYGDISNRVMDTLSQFSESIEIYSIDEMFLNLNGFNINLKAYGHDIKSTLWQHIRMPVGVGIAPTKTLAKLANHAAKKYSKCEGVCVLDTQEKQEWLLKKSAVTTVWGVGNQLAKKLHSHKIHTAWDLSQTNKRQIRNIGGVTLERTASELSGKCCLVIEDIQNKKHIISSRSFGNRISNLAKLHEAISLYCARATSKLRKQNQQVKTLYIFIKTSRHAKDFYQNSCTINLPYPTDDIRIITQYAKKGITKLFMPNKYYLKAGVGLVELLEKRSHTQDLFNVPMFEKSIQIMDTLDKINNKFGRKTTFLAAQGITQNWKMKQEYLSPAYTTDWNNLPIVN